MKVTLIFLYVTIISFISCDGMVGEKGIVQDGLTGERIKGVTVTLNSYYDDLVDSTNGEGFFYLYDSYSCGIKKCDDNFTMTFEKKGYEPFSIDEEYSSSNRAKYTSDTLIIELTAI